PAARPRGRGCRRGSAAAWARHPDRRARLRRSGRLHGHRPAQWPPDDPHRPRGRPRRGHRLQLAAPVARGGGAMSLFDPRRYGIRARLVLMVTLLVGAIAGLATLYFPARLRSAHLEALAEETGTVAQMVAEAVAAVV